ncbi:hypothetical protein VPNG_07043 [Cytospora leucostoma]|uniref:2-isopropylmalate synthase n=1 Tax=Cytospora leucostoma TaxID=1230097 RepID=A0A423WN95_9PEZI|nr:hypothetical protein VPNG_07043 [Cytospora leucostoma]
MLIALGYKEIEVSTPTASATEYNFTRQLIDTADAVPRDVWLQVLCPCRIDLIKRTVESLRGANKVIISLYHASSPVMLDTVFGMSEKDVHDRVVEAVTYCKSITKDDPSQQGTTWNLMFSPEAFSASDTLSCLRLCEAAKSIWEPTVEIPIILTLPATVEVSTPNVYADQVELFSKSIPDREKVCVSLHVHNDRGCAVAAAELGQMAGAERVEGCLFGNGERAGNVDLVTLALNLYSQGVDPGIDLSDLASVRAFVEEITNIKLHPRTPYAGALFFTAYSGAHQDAINKGLAKFKAASKNGQQALWKVPYLAMDPADLGSRHDDIIRLNSQSGKGGVAWTLFHALHIRVPKGLQLEFSKVVKSASEMTGGIISPPDVGRLFVKHYFISEPDPRIVSAKVKELGASETNGHAVNGKSGTSNAITTATSIKAVEFLVNIQGRQQTLQGQGPTVTIALSNALAGTSFGRVTFNVSEGKSESPSSEALGTILYVECYSPVSKQYSWGVRRAQDSGVSQLLAALSAALNLLDH